MAENWPPLASPGNLTQSEVLAASLQYAEATDKRAWLSDDERVSIEQADRGGGRILLQGVWSFVFKITRLKLVKRKRPSKLVRAKWLPPPPPAPGSIQLCCGGVWSWGWVLECPE
jgi:hypothetical protein